MIRDFAKKGCAGVGSAMKVGVAMALLISATTCGFAATETLFTNWTFAVSRGDEPGKLWVYSEGDAGSGISYLSVSVDGHGVVRADSSYQEMISDSLTAVQSGFNDDELAELRRAPFVTTENLGLVLPMLGSNSEGRFVKPKGFFEIRHIAGNRLGITESELENSDAVLDREKAMDYAVSGLAYDSAKSVLWLARGVAGVTRYDVANQSADPKIHSFVLNAKDRKLDSLKLTSTANLDKYAAVYGVAVHPQTGELWMATAKGLWIRESNGSVKSATAMLDTCRVTGVWIGGKPLQIVVETSKYVGDVVKDGLWRRTEKSKDFSKVAFLDTGKVVQKKDVYGASGYTVSNVAFVGPYAFVGVRAQAGGESGFLKLDSLGVRAYKNEEGFSWLHGFSMGPMSVTDRDVNINSITSFPMKDGVEGLAVSTYGNGISVSADTGATWTPILNRAKLGGDLGTVRMVPSVIVAGDQSLVSYKVSKPSKITIEVFSYDMKKVRRIVKSAPRSADASRSTDAREDFWDGKDDYGRACTMGVYYVRVKDNHGHVGWGKVMTLGGHK